MTNETWCGRHRKKPVIVATLASLCFAFNNAEGHDVIYGTALRTYFFQSWLNAETVEGHKLSFEEFRRGAGLYQMIYNNSDVDATRRDIALLSAPSCLPLSSDNEDNPSDQGSTACHAAGLQNRKKSVEKGFKPN